MKKTLVILSVFVLLVSHVGNVSASEIKNTNSVSIEGNEQILELYLNDEEKENLDKYHDIFIKTGMFNEFYLGGMGEFQHDLSFEQIQKKYDVSKIEIEFVINFVEYYNQSILNINSGISPRFTIKNFRIYLSYNETKSYLGSAVTNGSIAVVGALAVLGATVGGPLGAVISGLAGIYGANYIVEQTKSALRKKRGVWIGWGGIGIN